MILYRVSAAAVTLLRQGGTPAGRTSGWYSARGRVSMINPLPVVVILTLAAAQAQTGAMDGVRPRAAPAERPAVLMLSVDDPSRPWTQLVTQGFHDVVQAAPEPPIVYHEYFDVTRFGEADYDDDFRAWLRRKYRDKHVDLLVIPGQESVEFLARGRGEPWPGVPVLYAEFGELTIDISESLPGATGVILQDHVGLVLETIKRLLPDTERVVLLHGASDTERARFAGFAPLVRAANLEPIDLGSLSMEGLQQRVAHLPERTVMLLLAIVVDGAGRSLPPRRPCELIAAVANRPLFSPYRIDFGCGLVGGPMVDFQLGGRALGEATLKRLRGQSAPTVTMVPAARHAPFVYDARQLERWGISEGRLPAGSTVLFRRPNLWRDHRPEVMGALVVGAVQTLLIIGLLVERKRRHAAERDARRHLATAAHLDRRAVAGELAAALTHELNQPLGAIVHNAEAAELMLNSGSLAPEELREILADIRKDDKRAAEIIRKMRDLLRKQELTLRPLDINELVAETADLIAPELSVRDVTLDVRPARGLPDAPGDRIHLQQVLLNVLLNSLQAVASQPANSRRIMIQTGYRDGHVEVTVIDSGVGFAPDQLSRIFEPFFTTKADGLGVGLSITQTIIEAHGGEISAENNVGRSGATVRFRLPSSAPGEA